MNPPCYDREAHADCPKRCVGCRSTCKEWQDYEAAKKEEYARRLHARRSEYRELPPGSLRKLHRKLKQK